MFFDLICKDGSYHTFVKASEPPRTWKGRPVERYLRLNVFWRIPIVGLMARNFWAKRHGANFDPEWD